MVGNSMPVCRPRCREDTLGLDRPAGAIPAAIAKIAGETALLFDVVYVSGGRRGFDLGLSPTDLLAVTGGTAAPIARD